MKNNPTLIVAIVVVILVVVLGAVFLLPKSQPPKPAETPTAIDTSLWQTYRNEQYGFEVKLPPDWEASIDNSLTPNDLWSSTPGGVSPEFVAWASIGGFIEKNKALAGNYPPGIELAIYVLNQPFTTIDSFINALVSTDKSFQINEPDLNRFKVEKINLGQKTGYKLTRTNLSDRTYIFIPYAGYILGVEEDGFYPSIFSNVLTTFKFTN